MSRMPDYTIRTTGVMSTGTGLSSECCLSILSIAERVVHVSVGMTHCAVVCASGRAYTLGRAYILGRTPCRLSKVRIVQSACGYQTTFFVTDKGELYASGVNDQGQLGVGSTTDCTTPTLVKHLPPVKKIAAGYKHTVVLTEDGEVWVCGRNDEGQIGVGLRKKRTTFVKVPELSQRVIDIACGRWHTAILTESKHLIMSGWNHYRQLGTSTCQQSSRFQLTSLLCYPIAAVACGSNHTVALGVDGTVMAWGWNEEGQLGNGKFTYFSEPEEVVDTKGYKVSRVFAGGNHTALLMEGGEILVCGRGLSGELGNGLKNISKPTLWPKSLRMRVEHVAFGPEHCLLLVKREGPMDGGPETVEDCVTALERHSLRCLECPVCFKIMHAQIHLCINGHSLCGSCYSRLDTQVCPKCRGTFIPGKNIALQTLASEIALPCMDCLTRMPVMSLERHANVCSKRVYDCPLEETCGWTGRPETMLAHATSTHPRKTWQILPHTFTHTSLTRPALEHTDLVSTLNEIFLLHRRYNQEASEVHIFLQYIGLADNANMFRLRADFCINSKDWNVTFCKKVASDVATIEEMLHFDYCVSIKIDGDNDNIQKHKLRCKINILQAHNQ